jgi:phosphotransferase system HPr (HPr) family protein
MSEKTASCEVVVTNPQGFHARPASAFVKTAMKYRCSIHVVKDSRPHEKVDGKQVIELLLLSAPQGTKLTIHAQGDDAEEALAVLTQLVQSGFGEMEEKH